MTGVCRRESLSSLRWPGTKKGRKERRCPSDPSLSFPRLCFQKGSPPPMVPQAGHLQGGVVFQIQTINMLKEPQQHKKLKNKTMQWTKTLFRKDKYNQIFSLCEKRYSWLGLSFYNLTKEKDWY